MKSTSLHRLNADLPARPWTLLFYILFNYLNNAILPDKSLDPALARGWFSRSPAWEGETFPVTSKSPSRFLQDAFWQALPWEALADCMGPLRVLDLGCGKGVYLPFFRDLLGERMVRYVGYDVQPFPQWPEAAAAHSGATFLSAGDASLPDILARMEINLVLSHSVLEHVSEDATLMRQLADHARAAGRPFVQVHQVPSEANFMKLYGFHGVRQYSVRSLSMLSRLFADTSSAAVISMGGRRCNVLHWTDITAPARFRRPDRRVVDAAGYVARLHEALRTDAATPATQRGRASCHALLLCSHGARPWLETAMRTLTVA